jgi:hypothetical protein
MFILCQQSNQHLRQRLYKLRATYEVRFPGHIFIRLARDEIGDVPPYSIAISSLEIRMRESHASSCIFLNVV